MSGHPSLRGTTLFALTLLACADIDAGPRDAGRGDATLAEPSDLLRHARRLSASQLRDSLRTVTGQDWVDYGSHAASLGEADHLTRLTEALDISIPFLRFAEDGARATCSAAVASERSAAAGVPRAILGRVDLHAPTDAQRTENLARLLLRFHGHAVSDPSDPRMSAWNEVLTAEPEGVSREDSEAARWEAICVGLVMHSDFLTY